MDAPSRDQSLLQIARRHPVVTVGVLLAAVVALASPDGMLRAVGFLVVLFVFVPLSYGAKLLLRWMDARPFKAHPRGPGTGQP